VNPVISPRELAMAIGVSESSLKRWADEGLITVSKTAGGHRRIAIGDAIRFIRTTRAPIVRPDVLGLGDAAGFQADLAAAEPPEDRLFLHLSRGNARDARTMLQSMYLSGKSVAEIADGPIRLAMSRMGELWQHDPAGVFIEHRATDICIGAVQQLRMLAERSEPAQLALGAAPAGDPYLLPSLLCAAALADAGWKTMNLGANTPFSAMRHAVDRHPAALMWLSVSHAQDPHEIEVGIEQLAQLGPKIVVGGRASADLNLPKDARIAVHGTLSELVTLAQHLSTSEHVPSQTN
jgi:methanogenic corrinoid protein MtbC1